MCWNINSSCNAIPILNSFHLSSHFSLRVFSLWCISDYLNSLFISAQSNLLIIFLIHILSNHHSLQSTSIIQIVFLALFSPMKYVNECWLEYLIFDRWNIIILFMTSCLPEYLMWLRWIFLNLRELLLFIHFCIFFSNWLSKNHDYQIDSFRNHF